MGPHRPKVGGIGGGDREHLRAGDPLADRHNKLAHLEAAQRISRVGSWELDTSSHEMFWSEETYRILGLAPSGDKTSLESFSRLSSALS